MRRLAFLAVLAALAVPAVAAAFANTEPDASKEWYLDQDQAWSFWPSMPSLAPVQLQQRKDDGTWATLAPAVADSTSAWSFTAQLAAGTYRVRAAPGHGVTAGVSAPFTVQ